MKKKLYRSATDKKIAGVCGGIAEYFGMDSTIIRLIFVVCVLCLGTGVLAYIICAIVMPVNPVSDMPYTNYDGSSPYNNTNPYDSTNPYDNNNQ